MNKPRFQTFRVPVGHQTYAVLCRVVPARAAAHVSADSPRFLDVGSPGSLSIIRVLKGATDVTDALDRDLRDTIQNRACLMAGVRCASMPVRGAQAALELGGTT